MWSEHALVETTVIDTYLVGKSIYNHIGRNKKTTVIRLKSLLIFLLQQKHNEIFLSQKTLAKQQTQSQQTISNQIKKLNALDLVRCSDRHYVFYTGNTRTFLKPKSKKYLILKDRIVLLLEYLKQLEEEVKVKRQELMNVDYLQRQNDTYMFLQFLVKMLKLNTDDCKLYNDIVLRNLNPKYRLEFLKIKKLEQEKEK